VLGFGILDPERNHHLVALAGDRDFAPDIFALIVLLREDEQHCASLFDRVGVSSSNDIPLCTSRGAIQQRNPRRSTSSHNLRRCGAVLTDVAHEQKSRRHHQRSPTKTSITQE
jgi:hypothetical protein